MIITKVNFPKVENDTVTFSWHTDKSVPFFKKENFFIKYEGLNLENFSNSVFWNAFLAIIVPVYKLCDEEVVFVFPESISDFIAETWLNFHGANNVTIIPLSDTPPTELFKSNYEFKGLDSKIGILFGGGKDSSYSFSVLSEIYGMENIVLISYSHPWNISDMNKIDKRREKFLLENLRKDSNVRIQKIITDFMGTVTKPTYAFTPHTALYTGTVLPVIKHYNLDILTHNNEFIHYTTGYLNSPKKIFNYRRSRPEYDEYVSKRTNTFFNTNLSIINLSYFLSETAAFKILAKRYPNILKNILMCETTDSLNTKWCLDCKKCCEYVLYSLCFNIENPQIDYDFFFTKSPYISDLMGSVVNLKKVNNENPNYPCPPGGITCVRHYQSFCHLFALIDTEEVRKKLSDEGFKNFMILKNMYGNTKYPISESFIKAAFEKLNPPLVEKFKDIITLYCPPIEEIPKFFYVGNNKLVIDYSLTCPIEQVFDKEHSNDIAEILYKKS